MPKTRLNSFSDGFLIYSGFMGRCPIPCFFPPRKKNKPKTKFSAKVILEKNAVFLLSKFLRIFKEFFSKSSLNRARGNAPVFL